MKSYDFRWIFSNDKQVFIIVDYRFVFFWVIKLNSTYNNWFEFHSETKRKLKNRLMLCRDDCQLFDYVHMSYSFSMSKLELYRICMEWKTTQFLGERQRITEYFCVFFYSFKEFVISFWCSFKKGSFIGYNSILNRPNWLLHHLLHKCFPPKNKHMRTIAFRQSSIFHVIDTICHTCMILSSDTEQMTHGSFGFHEKSDILAVWPPWINWRKESNEIVFLR